MRITAVDYYGSDGKLIKRFLMQEAPLAPMAARQFTVEQNDTSGGSGASFLVRWRADAPMNEPVVVSVMIGTANSKGSSFTSRGVEVQE